MHSTLPYALGIHTTTPELGLCLSHSEMGMSAQTWELGRAMSTQLHEHLSSFIQPDTLRQLDFIAVASGPGGFTSTRLGVVTARTLAQQLNIPLFGISSLAAFVWHHAQQLAHNQGISSATDSLNTPLQTLNAVHMPARRGQVFGAVYSVIWSPPSPEPTLSNSGDDFKTPIHAKWCPQALVTRKVDHVIHEKDWNDYLKIAYSESMTTLEINQNLGNTVSSLLELATIEYQKQHRPHWSGVQPFYGQSPV